VTLAPRTRIGPSEIAAPASTAQSSPLVVVINSLDELRQGVPAN